MNNIIICFLILAEPSSPMRDKNDEKRNLLNELYFVFAIYFLAKKKIFY
jgi:hypothetical protein